MQVQIILISYKQKVQFNFLKPNQTQLFKIIIISLIIKQVVYFSFEIYKKIKEEFYFLLILKAK
jgi:hypothetical protein